MDQPVFDMTQILTANVLQQIPDAFYEATGLATGIHNTGGELVTTIPRPEFCGFCRNMFFSREGHRRCIHSNFTGESKAFRIGGTYIYHCHAGLIDVAAPIVVNGNHIGSVTCGQILVDPLTDAYRERVWRSLASFPREFRDMQMKALENVQVFPLKRVRGLAQLLSHIANNIVNLIISNMKEKEINQQNLRILDEVKARAVLEQQIKNAQLSVKDAELKALQAQINPHFLYNTLDSIQWLAVLRGADDIQKTIQALGQLLRHSLDRKSPVVSVRREMEQVRNYLFIQKMRYGEKLAYVINIQPEVLEFQLPKIVLQPLVENAILHGVEPREGSGSVRIEGWLAEPDRAIIEVIDDGVGIDGDVLARFNSFRQAGAHQPGWEEEGSPHRLGLMNVHKRLVYYFGDDCGLSIEKGPRAGTRVSMIVPRQMRQG
jgi:ligand-binding sensor protein